MESGFSRELFAEWAGHPRNSIILTCRGPKGTLAYDLINRGGNDRVIQLDMHKRVKLTGLELEEYRHQQREEKAKAKQASSLNDGVLIMEDDESSDEEMETLATSNKKGGKGGTRYCVSISQTAWRARARRFAPPFPYRISLAWPCRT